MQLQQWKSKYTLPPPVGVYYDTQQQHAHTHTHSSPRYHMRPTRSMAAIPNAEDVFPISDTLLVARLGTVWRKSTKGFGMQSNEYIGTATLRAPPSSSTNSPPLAP